MDPLLLTQLIRPTLSMDDPDSLGIPLDWVWAAGQRLLEIAHDDQDLLGLCP